MCATYNSWKIYYFQLFSQLLNELEYEVRNLKEQLEFEKFRVHPKTKLLKSIFLMITEEVPNDPGHSNFQLGNTLGSGNRGWYRVKKGLPKRYRLFYKFDSTKRTIIYVWFNDESTLRKEGAKTDVYAVFKKMLDAGKVPSSFDELLLASSRPDRK